jgi:ABC-type nitrate/sulfonate/bicarbonate transport system ATPase subunit
VNAPADRNTALISFEEVSKTFITSRGEVPVLFSLNLTLKEERTLCIVGPSGCGKTTILSLAAGFLAATSGVVRMKGVPIEGPGPDRAVVFQRDAVFPWLTVRQNLEYGPRMMGLPRRVWAERVEEYLSKVGLTDFADLYPKQLSGGMRKRVDIARAYTNQPDVLLMDEPFGPLDVLTKEVMQKDLLELSWKERKSLIFITHDIEEAVLLGDEVLVMTPRPAKVAAHIKVPFPRPRDIGLKLQSDFQELRKEINALLKSAPTNV